MQVLNFVDGAFQNTPQVLENVTPSTGEVFGTIPRSGAAEVDQAMAAAKRAFPAWSKTPVAERAACLERLADAVRDHADVLAKEEARDNGKPLSLASQVDIPRAEKNLRFYASGVQHYASESHAMEGEAINYTLRKPLGVVACISPWNLPLYLFTWKVAPALAAGNCVVAKPSELTPVTAYLLSTWVKEAGFPDGVFNVLHGLGPEVGEAMVTHPDIAAVSFTGGTTTGARIAGHVAPKFKKMSLELGGKNPAIIFEDADFEDALRTTLRSSFANQGQICLCGSRILIQRPSTTSSKKPSWPRPRRWWQAIRWTLPRNSVRWSRKPTWKNPLVHRARQGRGGKSCVAAIASIRKAWKGLLCRAHGHRGPRSSMPHQPGRDFRPCGHLAAV